jgi:hypothetical protein
MSDGLVAVGGKVEPPSVPWTMNTKETQETKYFIDL